MQGVMAGLQGLDRTALGGARSKLVRLPDPVLALIIALSSYQLLDRGQLDTTLRRIATGETSPLLEGDEREAYAWRVVGELLQWKSERRAGSARDAGTPFEDRRRT